MGVTESGDRAIRPFESEADVFWAAAVMAGSEPWITLRRDESASRALLSDTEKERYVLLDGGKRAGFLVLNLKGALAGYIQIVCVAPGYRDRGLGTRLITFGEERILRERPNVFLCVSSFNAGARRLYERLGYRRVGELEDFLVTGQSETLMRKTTGPLHGFTPR
jgi:ribosomal protein S18 acetylase RimI-like enzyme